MKIIDLLNKIANGEDVPKKIIYQNYIYEYQHRRDTENSFNYMCNENGKYLSRRYFIDNILNDEVEILEEENKIPEKIQKDDFEGINEEEPKLWIAIRKINEIIDYLKSKGE